MLVFPPWIPPIVSAMIIHSILIPRILLVGLSRPGSRSFLVFIIPAPPVVFIPSLVVVVLTAASPLPLIVPVVFELSGHLSYFVK